jgi:phage protein D
VGDEVNFSQETVNAANRLNFSSNTVLNMIDGAVGSPSLTADDSLLLDGWDNETNETKTVESNETKAIESNVTKATEKASTPLPKQQLEETMTPIAPHSSNKIALDIIEDYAGWE